MTIRLHLIALLTAFAVPTVAHAGGPVIVEDTEEAAPVRDREIGAAPIIIGLLILGAIIAGGSDSAPCNGPGETPDGGCK